MSLPAVEHKLPCAKKTADSFLLIYGYNPESDYGYWRVKVSVCGHVTQQGRYSPTFAILNEEG